LTGDLKPQTGHDVVDALLFAAHRVRNAADARLRERGLSLQGFKLMRALENSDRSMREISDVLHVSPRTVTDMIDGLEARRLVARHAHPADRRVTLVRLTDEGREQLAAATAGAERTARAAISDLSATDQQTLRRLLDRIAPADADDNTAEHPATVGA
jgi:DNA-binding MarR family transcriptional regulator